MIVNNQDLKRHHKTITDVKYDSEGDHEHQINSLRVELDLNVSTPE
jgi:hypothetical protein